MQLYKFNMAWNEKRCQTIYHFIHLVSQRDELQCKAAMTDEVIFEVLTSPYLSHPYHTSKYGFSQTIN